MFARITRGAMALLFLMGGLLLGSGSAHAQAEDGAGSGATLWRTGDRDGAVRAWTEALAAADAPAAERARLAYNLGIAAHRADDPLLAIAWFTACLRIDPRHHDARANLAIARTDAGLEDVDGGGPASAALGWARRYTRSEAEWLAVLGGVLLLAGGLLEAFRGRPARIALVLGAAVQPVMWAPLAVAIASDVPDAHMVVEPRGLLVYPMPEPGTDKVGKLAAGDVVEALDELPGWRKVRFQGEERWVRASGLAPLDLDPGL